MHAAVGTATSRFASAAGLWVAWSGLAVLWARGTRPSTPLLTLLPILVILDQVLDVGLRRGVRGINNRGRSWTRCLRGGYPRHASVVEEHQRLPATQCCLSPGLSSWIVSIGPPAAAV